MTDCKFIAKKFTNLSRALAVMLTALFFVLPAPAQRSHPDWIAIKVLSDDKIAIDFHSGTISLLQQNDGSTAIYCPATNGFTRNAGEPMLPLFHQIIRLPHDASIAVSVSDTVWETLLCPVDNITKAPDILLKSGIPIDETPLFYDNNLLNLTPLGSLMGKGYGRLEIRPFRITNGNLEVCRQLSATITINSPSGRSKEFSSTSSLSQSPETYLFVIPNKYREQIQPLASWKRQEGYKVEMLYIDSVAPQTISKALKRRHDMASAQLPAPTYILLVGDVDQIPLFNGRHNIPGLVPNKTDLYYAEFTGDYLPDAFLGRLSVEDTAQLSSVVTKTLKYEKYLLDDTAYLHRSLLVAGKELRDPAPTVTNGQVNYLKRQLSILDSLHDTICFYNPQSENSLPEIMEALRDGVALTSYSAHCNQLGWRSPYLKSLAIDTMSLPPLPFLSVNNCCRVNEIDGDCFGEHLLRRPSGGAIGVIGASNETLWNEDFYWSVGNLDTLTIDPLWSEETPGAFDRLFHLHNEPVQQQAQTQGELLAAGNWSVTRSGSQYDAFYWEVYSLLGDPSLMPYIGVPSQQSLTVDPIAAGDTTVTLHGSPFARIGASMNDTVYGFCTLDSNGNATMKCLLPLFDTVLFTATGQNRQPLQQHIATENRDGAFIVATKCQLMDLDSNHIGHLSIGDTALIAITLRNVGTQYAYNHHLVIDFSQSSLCLSDTSATVFSLPPQSDTSIVISAIPQNGHATSTLLLTTSHDSIVWQHSHTFDLLAPQLTIDINGLWNDGQRVTRVADDTPYTLSVNITNNGFADSKNVMLTLLETNSTVQFDTIKSLDSKTHDFSVTSESASDTLTITLQLIHNCDTTIATFKYPYDTDTSTVRIVPTDSVPVTLVPNPASESIVLANCSGNAHVTIHNIRGQLIDQRNIIPGQQIPVGHLPQGIYIVTILNSNSHPKTLRLVIAR